MKKVILFLPILSMVAALYADQAEPVCEKCQRIRAYNSAHPENNYLYYEDYLKDQQKKQAQNTKSDTKPTKDVADVGKPTPTPKK